MTRPLTITLFSAALLMLAGCSQPATEQAGANDAAANTAVAKPHPTYCFFKDAETKGWRASRDAAGNVAITGKAHVKDARYQAGFSETDTEVDGANATLWLAISENQGYAAPDNWWDVSFAIPDSAAVTAVTLQCGKKTIADLSVPR